MENNPVQFIQGNSVSELTNPIQPGSIYFFKDGGIIWDNSEERVVMTNGVIVYTKTFTSPLEIRKSTGEEFNPNGEWKEGQSDWVTLIDFEDSYLPSAGSYAIEICLNSGVVTIGENQHIIIDNFYSGTVSLPNRYFRGIDEILLHRAGGRDDNVTGMVQTHHIYARLYGNMSDGEEDSPTKTKLQLQIASSSITSINTITVKLRKLF